MNKTTGIKITKKQLAIKLGCCGNTINHMINDGRLPMPKIASFPKNLLYWYEEEIESEIKKLTAFTKDEGTN